ncbi:hypothetical protein IG631_09929 [Alternaria alternata]|nr:hypothetical protein IG631_09929 [Alternaria alternata]
MSTPHFLHSRSAACRNSCRKAAFPAAHLYAKWSETAGDLRLPTAAKGHAARASPVVGFDPGSAKLTIVLNHEAGWRDCAQAGSLFDVSRYDGGVGCGLGMWPVFREKSGFLRRRAELWGRCV